MKVLVVFAVCVVAVATAGRVYPFHQPLSDELIHFVNEIASTTWKVGRL